MNTISFLIQEIKYVTGRYECYHRDLLMFYFTAEMSLKLIAGGKIMFGPGAAINGVSMDTGILTQNQLHLDGRDELKKAVEDLGITRYGFSCHSCSCVGVDKTGLIFVPKSSAFKTVCHEVCEKCCPPVSGLTQHEAAYRQYMSHAGYDQKSYHWIGGYAYLRYSYIHINNII